MSKRVFLHIGPPKTGTTYLQERLALNATSLRLHGYRYPTGRRSDMFLAALDLLDRPWGGLRPQASGEWPALVRRTHRARARVVLSHEILAGAEPAQARRALADLSFAHVEVVYGARDLARLITAEWQELLKHQRSISFGEFVKRLHRTRHDDATQWFWRVHDLPGVLERWSHGLEPSQVHVVTVPRAGGTSDLLWHRFCSAVGIDPAWAPLDTQRANVSVGAAESMLLREVNTRLKSRGLPSDQYRALIRRAVVHEALAGRPAARPVTLPPGAYAWADELTHEWIEWVRASGFHVIGDLDDLRPARPDPDDAWYDPDQPGSDEVAGAAIDAMVALTLEAARRPDPDAAFRVKMSKALRNLRR